MSSQPGRLQETPSNPSENPIAALYRQLLDSWNQRDAQAFAALFDVVGNVIGFDGSAMNGRAEIESTIRQIFLDHVTAAYVSKIRGIRFLTPEVAILQGVAGMVPPGESTINPAVNAMQTLVAAKQDSQWCIALFQNTPAQFHGRPEVAESLNEELRQLL